MQTDHARHEAFRQLHQSGCFVIPNPWDLGSARLLEQLGFKALASTSAGFAWSRGRADNHVGLEATLEHLRAVASAVDVPINADFEGGYAIAPDGVAENVQHGAMTGVSGISIEDSTGNDHDPLFAFDLAVARVAAARRAIDRSGVPVLLTGRSEGFIAGRPDLEETIRRLTAYAEVGADCLYAPGIRTMEQVHAIVRAVAPRPVNVLVGSDWTTVADLTAAGVRRISVGGALARTAWGGFLTAAREIATAGTFQALTTGAPSAFLNQSMSH